MPDQSGYGEIDKTLNVDSRDNVTVSWYQFCNLQVDPTVYTTGQNPFLRMEEYNLSDRQIGQFWTRFEMSVERRVDGSHDFYRFMLTKCKMQLLAEGPAVVLGSGQVVVSMNVSLGVAHQKWLLWAIYMCENRIVYYNVSSSGEPSGDPVSVPFLVPHDIRFISTLALIYTKGWPNSQVSYYIDDLWVMAKNGTKALFHEDFSYGDVTEMLDRTDWQAAAGSYPEYHMFLTTAKNMGFSRSVLNIDPVKLSRYENAESQIEFKNGWYTPTVYTREDASPYKNHFSGYSQEMAGYVFQKYYQHYFTLLEIPVTGLYDLTFYPAFSVNRAVYIDGTNTTLNGNGLALVYLRTGIAPLYLRMYGDGANNVNAFRVHIAPHGFTVDKIRAFVPDHGRMTAVYYDADYSSRLREYGNPSFYEGATTATEKAAALMTTGSVGGPKVVLDAHDLLSYMLRDINTGFYNNGRAITPMYETAGSVIMSSDAVPDTIYKGEYEGSIAETFLEMNGYMTMDGNLPFYMTTHHDGSASIWPKGPEWVLDMPVNNAWYRADGNTVTFGPKDIPYEGLWSQGNSASSGPKDEMWASSYTYDMPISHSNYYYCLRVIHSAGQSEYGRGTSIYYDSLFPVNPWYPVPESPWQQSEYGPLLAPGATKLKLKMSFDSHLMIWLPGGGWMPILLGSLMETKVIVSNMLCDGNFVYNSTASMTNQTGYETDKYPLVSSVIIDAGTVEVTKPFWVTLDLSGYDELYYAFLNFLQYDMGVYLNWMGGWVRGFVNIEDIQIEKTFEVATDKGIAPEYEMALPMLDTGSLTDISFPRTILSKNLDEVYSKLEMTRAANKTWWGQIFGKYLDTAPYKDEVRAKIRNYARQNLVDLHADSSGEPFRETVLRTTWKSATVLMGETDFKGADNLVNDYVTRIYFEPTGGYSKYSVLPYYWQVFMPGGNCTSAASLNEMYKHWMPEVSVTLTRTAVGGEATEIGSMLYGDLSQYTPEWGVRVDYLESTGRRYLEYGTFKTSSSVRVSTPVSFQADAYGGGILSYGLSQKITRDHVFANCSITEAYVDYLVRANHMNMWGHTIVKKAVSYAALNYTMEDRLELLNSEGWVEECANGGFQKALDGSLLDTAIPGTSGQLTVGDTIACTLNPVGFAVGKMMAAQQSNNELIRLADQSTESGAARNLGTDTYDTQSRGGIHKDFYDTARLGNGKMDTFIQEWKVDYNGANWYWDPNKDLRDETGHKYATWVDSSGLDWPSTQRLFLGNQSLKVRPSLSESSDLDPDDPRFTVFVFVKTPGTVLRHQVMRGKSVTIGLDWANALKDYTQLYAVVKVDTSKELAHPVWINGTIARSQGDIVVDLCKLVNEKTGMPLWVSEGGEFVSPVITVWLYQKNPNDCIDIVEQVRNMVYADVFYVRAEMDNDYLDVYFNIQQQVQRNQLVTRQLLCVVGGVMIVSGVGAVWGADMITQSLTGRSMFDWGIQGIMRAIGVREDFVESFSLFHFVSDAGTDLMLMQLTCFAIGGATGMLKSGLRNLGVDISKGFVNNLGFGRSLAFALRLAGKRIEGASQSFLEGLLARGVARSAISATLRITVSCFFQSLMQLAFMTIDSQNRGTQPMFGLFGQFGKYLFFGLLAASAMSHKLLHMRFPDKLAILNSFQLFKTAGLAAKSMQFLMLAMSFSVVIALSVT
jgi:hypothetical protein